TLLEATTRDDCSDTFCRKKKSMEGSQECLWNPKNQSRELEITMSTTRKLKNHGMRRGKNRVPHKGVKRGGGKRKYRKSSLKSRKRGNDGSACGLKIQQFTPTQSIKRNQMNSENLHTRAYDGVT
ncbi:hypothetical protein STEG23_014234, partial [Scotinomys teguina]